MGQLSPNAQTVNGTGGLNAGAAKQMGWTPQDIQNSGTTPNVWQNLVKGGATGLANGLQSYGQQPQGQVRGGGQISGMQPANVNPAYFQPGSATGNPGGMPGNRKANNPYFYGYGQGQ